MPGGDRCGQGCRARKQKVHLWVPRACAPGARPPGAFKAARPGVRLALVMRFEHKTQNHAQHLRALRRMTPEARLKKAFDLSDFARRLFICGLRENLGKALPAKLWGFHHASVTELPQNLERPVKTIRQPGLTVYVTHAFTVSLRVGWQELFFSDILRLSDYHIKYLFIEITEFRTSD